MFVKILLMNKVPLLFTLIFFVLYKVISFYTGEIWLPLLVLVVPVGLLIVNLMIRKSLRYKTWFLCSLNFLLERKSCSTKSEISADLLFDKIIEVIGNSEFKLLDTDKDHFYILCGTSTNLLTWGENIYIQIEKNGDDAANIQFVSTTLFGGSSWKRNQNNYESLIASFEESLTI
jgi:hypothetical protein